ncbi:MAG: hypothetical protein D6795_10650 [Deltaproteobacteria bacterium]|nr:MAG: hypothetical protein D6795_10650 [Deltaproteobacteria bacterium]
MKPFIDSIIRNLHLPELASAHGYEIDYLLALVHILMFLLFVGWGIFFIYCLIRFRSSRQPKANYQGVRHHLSSWLEFGVAMFEAVLLIGFAIPVWAQWTQELPAQKDAVPIRIVAQQFAWNVHYPGKDGIFGKTAIEYVNEQTNPVGLDPNDPAAQDDIVTVNQLHLPVNRPARIEITSKDVIHSFFLPQMRVKQDAIPGLKVPVGFTPTVTTEEMRKRMGNEKFNYEIACAQLCGNSHYRMRGYMTIDSQKEFEAWLAAQTPVMAAGQGEEESEYE